MMAVLVVSTMVTSLPATITEFQVSTYMTNDQNYPSVAMDANGNFVIAWQSDGQDGSGSGIFMKRYFYISLSPDISVSPTIYNFGNILEGTSSAPQTFTISNIGTAYLIIDTASITSDDIQVCFEVGAL
jgi:hypothetical protein